MAPDDGLSAAKEPGPATPGDVPAEHELPVAGGELPVARGGLPVAREDKSQAARDGELPTRRRESTRSSSGLRRLLHFVGIAVVLGLSALVLRKVNGRAVLAALRGARWPLILVAALINFFHLYCRAQRWRALISPVATVGRLRLFHYMVVGSAASIVLPAQAGEFLRLYVLRRRDGVPLSASAGALLLEKLFDVIQLLLVTAPLPYLLPLPGWVASAIKLVVFGGAGGLLLAVVVAVRLGDGSDGTGTLGMLRRLGAGLQGVRRPATVGAAFLWSVGAVLTDCLEVYLVLLALGIVVPWPGTALALLTINLSIAVPSTPGHVGALEAGAVAGLGVLGVAASPALAFALLYHVMQLVPVLLAGLSGLRLFSDYRPGDPADDPADSLADDRADFRRDYTEPPT